MMRDITEGTVKKGGQNAPPTTPRPAAPKGQRMKPFAQAIPAPPVGPPNRVIHEGWPVRQMVACVVLPAVLLALVALAMLTLGCVNPNRNNPDQYDACDFLSHMELTKLGLHDCETWKERDDGAGR